MVDKNTRVSSLRLCLAAMVAVLIHGLVDTTYFKNDLALLFWLVVTAALFSSTPNSVSVPLRPS